MNNNTPAVGLLRLSVHLAERDAALLIASASAVSRRLYVALRGDWAPLTLEQVQLRLAFVYQAAARACADVDVRVLLPCPDSDVAPGAPECDALLGGADAEAELEHVNARRASLGLSRLDFVAVAPAPAPPADTATRLAALAACEAAAPAATFRHVCVGGTFDYMHVGHKLLLSLSALAATERLVCGVSDAPLLKKKVLRELMQPVGLRMALVEDFLHAIKPTIAYELSALQDGYGPAIVDGALEAILVSAETLPGGHACNKKREPKGMAPLAVVAMPLVDEGAAESGAPIAEENKVSSTHKRRARLAAMRGGEEHWCRRSPPSAPYVIGLTGGIASGKSTARRLLLEHAASAAHSGPRLGLVSDQPPAAWRRAVCSRSCSWITTPCSSLQTG